MTDVQNKVIKAIQKLLLSLVDTDGSRLIKNVIRLPELESTGLRFPSVFIEDKDEDYEWNGRSTAGCLVSYDWEIDLFLHTDFEKNRMFHLNDIQNQINTKLIESLSINNSNVLFFALNSVGKGTLQNSEYSDINVNDEGYYSNRSIRRLTYKIVINDSRG